MNELIEAWTRAGIAVAKYFEHKAGNPMPTSEEAVKPEVLAEIAAVKKERKTRATKAEAPVAAVAAPAAPPSVAEMTEDASILELRAVAKVFVQRFGNQADGIAAFRKLMADTCKVAKIDDLVHAQRLQMIIAAKAEIAKADKTAPATVGAGVEV